MLLSVPSSPKSFLAVVPVPVSKRKWAISPESTEGTVTGLPEMEAIVELLLRNTGERPAAVLVATRVMLASP